MDNDVGVCARVCGHAETIHVLPLEATGVEANFSELYSMFQPSYS